MRISDWSSDVCYSDLFWGLLLSWVAYLFPRVEDMLDGEPRLIISHGKLLKENFRRDRLTKAEIETEMRLAGIASISDVTWAVLEPEGKISFIKSQETAESRQTAESSATQGMHSDRTRTRLNSRHQCATRMPFCACKKNTPVTTNNFA